MTSTTHFFGNPKANDIPPGYCFLSLSGGDLATLHVKQRIGETWRTLFEADAGKDGGKIHLPMLTKYFEVDHGTECPTMVILVKLYKENVSVQHRTWDMKSIKDLADRSGPIILEGELDDPLRDVSFHGDEALPFFPYGNSQA